MRATIECFERGALTSATIMPDMPATEPRSSTRAAAPTSASASTSPSSPTALERPLADPAGIDRLLGPDGRFLADRRGAAPRAPAPTPRRADRAGGRGPARVPPRPRRTRLARRLAPARAQVRPLPRGARARAAALRRRARPQRPGRLAAAPADEPDVLARPDLAPAAHAPLHDDRALLHADERARHAGWRGPLLAAARGCSGGSLEVGVHPGSTRPGAAMSGWPSAARGRAA